MDKVLFEKGDFRVLRVAGPEGREAVLELSGDCASPHFMTNVAEIERTILGVPEGELLIDTAGVLHANSRFFSLLIMLSEADKRIRLKSPPQIMRELLEMVGVDQLFEIVEADGTRRPAGSGRA